MNEKVCKTYEALKSTVTRYHDIPKPLIDFSIVNEIEDNNGGLKECYSNPTRETNLQKCVHCISDSCTYKNFVLEIHFITKMNI